MRIAEVNDIASVGSEIAAGLRRRGHDAELIQPRLIGAHLSTAMKAPLGPVRAAEWGWLIRRIQTGHYDLAHIHYASLGVIGILGRFPFILHCHGTDLREATWLTQPLIQRALRAADHVFYSTPDLGKWVTPHRPDGEFLPNPIDTEAFRPTIPADERSDVFICCALTAIKGGDRLLEACQLLAERRPEIRISAIAGGEFTPQFEVLPNVVLLHHQRRAQLPQLINEHGIVMGWVSFGIAGMAELEAMACGRPVLNHFEHDAAYPEGPPLVRVLEGPEIAAAVERLYDDPGERLRLGEAGRAWVERYHRLDLAAARVETVAEGIVERTKAGAR